MLSECLKALRFHLPSRLVLHFFEELLHHSLGLLTVPRRQQGNLNSRGTCHISAARLLYLAQRIDRPAVPWQARHPEASTCPCPEERTQTGQKNAKGPTLTLQLSLTTGCTCDPAEETWELQHFVLLSQNIESHALLFNFTAPNPGTAVMEENVAS